MASLQALEEALIPDCRGLAASTGLFEVPSPDEAADAFQRRGARLTVVLAGATARDPPLRQPLQIGRNWWMSHGGRRPPQQQLPAPAQRPVRAHDEVGISRILIAVQNQDGLAHLPMSWSVYAGGNFSSIAEPAETVRYRRSTPV